MMYSTAINIRKVREELDRRHLSGTIQLAVGGAVFNLRPELVAEVGGDATAKVATDVPDLFERMISPKPFSKEGEPQ
jgi:methanogenic corrinoid protein MtbC1